MTFPEIKSLFEQTKANNPAAANLSLEEFARLGARSTGDPEMARIGNASPWENLIRTANQSLNQGIAAVTPDETLGEWSGNLAELVGVDRSVGEQVGRSLPRQIANVGAMAIPVVGPALSFGLSAADTYDQTGSLWQTAIAGAAPMVVGKAMNLGGNATLQAAAKSPAFQKLGVTGGREVIRNLTDDAASFLPVGSKTADLVIDQLPDKLVRFIGGEAAGQATGLALDVAAQGTDAVFNKDYLFANLLGNLAFAPLNITDFVGTKTINTGRTILPPDAGPVRTTSEQRAFEFESLLSSLSPTEKTRAERAAGFDISAQLLGERRLSQINKDFDDGMSQERVLLENDWKMLQEKEPLAASVPLEEALVDTSKLNVLAPEAKERIEKFQLKLKELDAVKKSRMDQMKVIGGAGDLLGVALDELKIPESLLQKSAGERAFEDYKNALDGKVSERGQQVIYSMHQLAAGKREELMAGPHREVAEEVEKVLQGKGTKFASDRSFVSMALWATGKKPLSDVEVKAKVEKKVKEGNTTKEAVVKVNQKQLAKVRGVDKAPRKKQVQVTERVQAMQTLVNEAAAAKKPDENQKALVDAYTFANSNPNVSGDEATMRALLSAMSKAWQKYEKPAERLQNFKNQVNKIVENTNKAKRRKELPVEEVKVNADELLDEDLAGDQVRDLDDEVVSELVTEVLGEDESNLQAKQKPVEEASTEDLTDGLIERRMYQIAADYFNIPVELAKQRVADLPAVMTKKLWDMAKSQLEMKQASSAAGGVPQVGMQKLMSLDEWSDTLLRSEGFSPEETQQLREHFANAVEMFYSPEVRYGKLGEKQDNLLFARAPAGGGFDFGMAEVKDGKLLRPGKGAVTPRKDGTLSLQEFKVAGGQFGVLQDGEIEFYKQIAPEAFAGDRVNVVQLWNSLQKAGEQVKVVTYGQDGDASPAKIELDRVNGELDILDYEWQEKYVSGFEKDSQGHTTQAILKSETPANIRALIERRNKASDLYRAPAQELPKATSYYNQISPFDTKKFPVVRVDVVLPESRLTKAEQQELTELQDMGNYSSQRYKELESKSDSQFWQPDNLHENLPNTLGWAMVQIVPHPVTGEKVMFVGEAQSRWGQSAQREDKRRAKEQAQYNMPEPYAALVQRHPLLPIHQNLILKSVIKEAQKQGISKVAVSDGESAMMTEGHDKVMDQTAPPMFRGPVSEESQISQSKGMRLAYDTTMPSIMKKLVGEGKVEDFGVHKNAIQLDPNRNTREAENTLLARLSAGEIDNPAYIRGLEEIKNERIKLTGSPVFRTPSGTPKTNATARVYDITAPSERLSSLFARANVSQTYAAAATRTRDIFFSPSALKGRNLILQQTSLLTHENSHVLFSKARSGSFGPEAQRLTSDFESWAKGLNQHEAETFVDVLSDVWLGKEWKDLPGVGDVLKNIRNEKGEVDVEEVMANVFGAYAAGLNKPSNPTKFYTMLPRVVRDMFDWVAKMTQGVVGAARMYGKFGGDVKQVRQAQKVKEVFDAVRRGARNAERNLSDLAELANLRQGDVLDKVEVMYAKGKYGSTGAGKWKEKLSYLFDNAIMRMGSLAATYDGLQDPFMKMKDFSPLNADLTAQVFSSLGMGKYGHTGLSVAKEGGWMKIRNSPELHKLASQINLEMQMLNQSLVTRGADGSLQFNTGAMTPELRGKFGMFKPEAQQAVAEYFVRRAEKANPIVQGVIVSKEWETQANKLHELLFESSYADFTGQFEKSKLWSEKVMKMAQNGDDAGVMAEVAALSDPVVQKQIGDYITAQSEKIRFLDAEYKKNPNFGSLRRFQPIKVKWIKAGETAKNMQANSAEEAERMDAELRAQGWTPQSVRITDFKSKGSDVFDSTTKVRVKDMEDRVKLALKEMAVPEEFKAELEKEIDFVGMIERTENAQSVFSTKAQRRFADGVEDLMVLEQDMLWMSKAIYAANRAALDSNVRVALKNPKLDNYLDAKQTFAQGYENFKTQNHEWLSKLSKANAAYFIGFNIPGHIAELMQPVMTHFAEMRYIGVKTQDALGIMLGASKDLVSFYKRNMKKFAKGEEVHLWDDWQNKDEKDMLFRMKHAINANPLNYAYSDVGFEQQKLIEATETGQKQSLLQAVSSPASAYANTGLKFYGLFTRHNAIMGLLNGYRAYRKIGLSHEEAVQKVGLFETVVNKSGGKADRQAFPFKNNAVLGHLFYGLQGYTTGWVSQLATYYRHGYKSDSYVGFKDNPEAIKRARSAFKTMLGAQFAAAGVMGMPMVGALTTLLEELTGDDIRGEMYEALDTVTNDPLLSQAASHGLSTALAERMGIPADLHGRFAIGGLLGFNAYDGFSASSLFGPTAGVMNSMWNLGKSLYQERDLQKAFTAGGPTGLRSIAKALDEELPLRNENALSTALGFNSAQARKEREFTRIAQKRNEKAAQEISHAARRVQDALALGSSVAQQKLHTEAMKLAETPEQLKDVIRSIGNKVKLFEEQKTFPKDIREVATPQTTAGLSQLAKAMGVRLPASQEVEREMLKQEVMRRMGMSPASQMRQAMAEDYSAVSDPWQLR